MVKKALAIIPARGGSKRVPRKNIREMCNKPLISYTIMAACQSKLFSRVVVSTDSEEIADIALHCGAEVPFIRKTELADDFTPVSLVTLDALNALDPDGFEFDLVAQLMPNCPLRDHADVISSHNRFIMGNAPSQISVVQYHWLNPWWALAGDDKNNFSFIFKEKSKTRSQDLKELVCPTGAIWWSHANVLKKERSFYGEGFDTWEIPWLHAIDIDTEDDWKIAEFIMKSIMNEQRKNDNNG